MTTVNNTTNNNNVNPMAVANGRNQDLMGETQDRFLTLLVTQLKNQDPLNPMDNAQVTSQIAQMSTVSGITQLNNTLLALAGQMDVSQSMQAAGLIGKEVLVPGTKVSVGTVDGTAHATPFGVDVISDAANIKVNIMDSTGKVVRTIDLGKQDVGVISVEWDGEDDLGGAVNDGAYTISVAATDADGKPVSADALTHGKVGSVSYTSNGMVLDMGLAGKYSLLDLRKIM